MTALPAVVWRTLKVTVVEEPFARLPRSQTMLPLVEQEPAAGTAALRTPDDGRNAVRAIFDAGEGPLFVTVAV